MSGPRCGRGSTRIARGCYSIAVLARAAQLWDTAGREPSDLYRGSRLDAARDWADLHTGELNAVERAFLDASVRQHDTEAEELAIRVAAQQRANRRLRRLLVAAAITLIVAIVAGAIAATQRDRAQRSARRADHTALVADSSRLAAQARVLGAEQLDLSLLLAVQGRRLMRSNATDGGLEAALARVPPGFESSARIPPGSGVVDASPDGRLLAVPGADDRVHLVDVHDARVVRTLEGFRSGRFGSATFDAGGDRVLGAADGSVTVWNVATGKRLGSPLRVGNGPVAAVFDPADPDRIFTAANGRLVHWDLRVPADPVEVGSPLDFAHLPGSDWPFVRVSPDGSLLAVGTLNTKASRVFDLRSERLQLELDGIAGPFTPDGNTLAMARDERIVLIDARTGAAHGSPLTGLHQANPAMVVSDDGRYLAASDLVDNAMRVFDLATGQPVGRSLAIFGGTSFPAAFLPGGRLLAADAGRMIVWRFASQASPLVTLLPGQEGAISAQFIPDGSEVITVNHSAHVVHRWRAADGEHLGRMLDRRAAPERPLGFSPDGRTVVTARPGGTTAGIFDVATGALLSVLDARQPAPLKTLWSPVAPIVALGSDDLSLTLWDVSDTRAPRLRSRLQTGEPTEGALTTMYPGFSPDGRTIGAFFNSGPARYYDVASGRRVPPLVEGSSFELAPDGSTAAVMRPSGKLAIIDTATGRTRAALANPPQIQTMGFTAGGKRLLLLLSPASGFTLFFSLGGAVDIADVGTTTVALYDTRTLERIGEPVALPGTLPFIAEMSRDGTRFATGADNSPEGVPAVWDLDPDRWEANACRLAGRNLTRAEWEQYLPGRPHEKTCTQWPLDES